MVMRRLLSYLKPHRKALVIAFILLLLTTAASVTGPILVQIFIDDYLTPGIFDRQAIILLAGAYLLLHFLSVFINYYQLLTFHKIAQWVVQQLRIDIFSKVQHLGLSYFDRTPAGSLLSRITNDTEAIKQLFISVPVHFCSKYGPYHRGFCSHVPAGCKTGPLLSALAARNPSSHANIPVS